MDEEHHDAPDIFQRIDNYGDHNQFNQIGQQTNFYAIPDQDHRVPLDVDAKWSWKSPLTQAALGWISLVFSVFSAATLFGFVRSLLDGMSSTITSSSKSYVVWFLLFFGCLSVLLLAETMRRIVRLRRHGFTRFSFLPIATESDGRFALAKYKGTCPICGGALRFYNKPVRWIDHPKDDGGFKREVIERAMAAECKRNGDDHWWKLDPTDTIV